MYGAAGVKKRTIRPSRGNEGERYMYESAMNKGKRERKEHEYGKCVDNQIDVNIELMHSISGSGNYEESGVAWSPPSSTRTGHRSTSREGSGAAIAWKKRGDEGGPNRRIWFIVSRNES